MKKESCPAWGKSCDACKGKNHFKNSERCPKSKKNVHGVHECGCSETDSSSCAGISTVTSADVCTIKSSEDSPVYCNMVVNKQLTKLQVDCGATVHVLPRRYVGNKEIRHEDVSLKMWNDFTMKAIGKCRVKTVNPVTGEKWKIDYVVVEEDLIPLLIRKAAEKMKLITINYDNFKSVSAVSTSSKTSDVVNDFPEVFDNNLGSLPGGKDHLTLAPNAEPVVRPTRALPESLSPTVKTELDILDETDVIINVDEPTDWVNQTSVVKEISGDADTLSRAFLPAKEHTNSDRV